MATNPSKSLFKESWRDCVAYDRVNKECFDLPIRPRAERVELRISKKYLGRGFIESSLKLGIAVVCPFNIWQCISSGSTHNLKRWREQGALLGLGAHSTTASALELQAVPGSLYSTTVC
jgi:hypothetical protein